VERAEDPVVARGQPGQRFVIGKPHRRGAVAVHMGVETPQNVAER
jgi:hypothetical protein